MSEKIFNMDKLLEEVIFSVQTLNLSTDDCVEKIVMSIGKLTINELNECNFVDEVSNFQLKQWLMKKGYPEQMLSKSKDELIMLLLEIIIDNYVTITTLKDYLKSIGRDHMGIKSIIINRVLTSQY